MSSCLRCGKKFDDGKLWKTTYSICYDKCRGKTCPDCGKVRKLGGFETIYTENPRFNSPCVRCKKITNHLINKVCAKCFSERERKRGCFCIWDKDRNEKRVIITILIIIAHCARTFILARLFVKNALKNNLNLMRINELFSE